MLFAFTLFFEFLFLIGVFIAKRTDIFWHGSILTKYKIFGIRLTLPDILFSVISFLFISLTVLIYLVSGIGEQSKNIFLIIILFVDLVVNVVTFLISSQVIYQNFLKMLKDKICSLKIHYNIEELSIEEITRRLNLMLKNDSCLKNDVVKALKKLENDK